jgi:hypothetical protein
MDFLPFAGHFSLLQGEKMTCKSRKVQRRHAMHGGAAL